jgi:pilus assembly protein CpaE
MASGSRDSVDRSLRALLVASDRALEDEFQSALSRLSDRQGAVYFTDSYGEAIDVARRRQPNFVLIAVDRDPSEVAALSRELRDLLPLAGIAAAFPSGGLEQDRSGSATIIGLLRAQVQDFLQRPLSATELRDVLNRLFARVAGGDTASTGRVMALVGNKGGVGRSTLAVNVACALALRYPDEVLLIDASLQLGSCAMLLDLQPATTIVDAIRERDRLDRTLLRHLSLRHFSGLRLLAAPADALEGAEVSDDAIARIVNLASRSFPYVIVDTFSLLDSVLMAVLDVCDAAFVVTQGTAPAVAGIARLLPVLDGLGLPAARQRLVVNYNYKPFLGNLRPSDIGARLDRPVDYVVPYDRRVLESVNSGVPRILRARRWERFGRAISRMVADLSDTSRELSAEEAPTPSGGRRAATLREPAEIERMEIR